MKKCLKLLMVTLGSVCAMGMTSLAGNWVGNAGSGWWYVNADGTYGSYRAAADCPQVDGIYTFTSGLAEGVGNYYTIEPGLQNIILMRKDPETITVFMNNQAIDFVLSEETMYWDEGGNGTRGLEVYDNGTLDLYLENRNTYTKIQ